MHKGTMASDSLRGVAQTVSATSILFCVHGIATDYELFSVIWHGFDLFFAVYGFGILIAVISLVALAMKWPKVEYASMSLSIWLYALICMFSALVTSLHSPVIVICLSFALIYAVLATHIKKGEIDGQENIGGLPTREDQLQSGVPSGDPSSRSN